MTERPQGTAPDALRQLMERAQQTATRAKAAGAEMAALEVSATSKNRAVIVTVGSGGVLKRIQPGANAGTMPVAQVCQAVMQAYAHAARQAAEQASEIMSEAVGRDTEAMAKMRESLPPDPEEEEEI